MGSLLEPTPFSLAAAQARLHELRRRACGALTLALAGIVGAVAAWLIRGRATAPVVALGAGVATALTVALLAGADRRRLLLALVAQGDAAGLAEVSGFAARLCTQSERTRLARALIAAADAGKTGALAPMLVDPARADAFGPRLRGVAEAIAAPGPRASAAAIALCRRLLSEAAISPLYNPRLPVGELARVLEFVERDIASCARGPEPLSRPAGPGT